MRVNPAAIGAYEQQRDWESLVSHAGSQSKFGIAEEELLSALQQTSLTISGLHLHVGTQMDHLGSFTGALALLHHLSDQIHTHTRQRLATLDLGGGFESAFRMAIPSPRSRTTLPLSSLSCAAACAIWWSLAMPSSVATSPC